VSYAKTAEPIEMQWNSESDGFMEHALHGDVDAAQEGALLTVSG